MKKLCLLPICVLGMFAGDGDAFLLRGFTVHPVSGGDIPNGSVLIRNGRIAGVGDNLIADRGVRIIPGKGLHVYPGMIDSATQIGLSEISSVRETNDTGELGEFNPQLRALIAINPASEHIPVTRANGITSVITVPAGSSGFGSSTSGAIISGQAALIHLDGWTWEEMELRRSAALNMLFPFIQTSRISFAEGLTRTPYAEAKKRHEEQRKKLHAFFESARRYQRAKAAGLRGFKIDLKLEAMVPVLEGKIPVMITAVRERAIREALQFAEKEKIRVILAQVREPANTLPELKAKSIPVILGPTFELPLGEDDPYDSAYSLPAELFKAGVKFAFGTFTTSFSRNLPYEAANAVAFGLPHEQALRAVTLDAAEIWGVGDQVGSIEKGKLADLVVTDGDLLETRTQVKQLFIKGKPVDLDNKHLRLYQKYRNRPS